MTRKSLTQHSTIRNIIKLAQDNQNEFTQRDASAFLQIVSKDKTIIDFNTDSDIRSIVSMLQSLYKVKNFNVGASLFGNGTGLDVINDTNKNDAYKQNIEFFNKMFEEFYTENQNKYKDAKISVLEMFTDFVTSEYLTKSEAQMEGLLRSGGYKNSDFSTMETLYKRYGGTFDRVGKWAIIGILLQLQLLQPILKYILETGLDLAEEVAEVTIPIAEKIIDKSLKAGASVGGSVLDTIFGALGIDPGLILILCICCCIIIVAGVLFSFLM